MTPGITLAGYLNGSTPVYVDMSAGLVTGSYNGSVQVTCGPLTSYAPVDGSMLVPPFLVGSVHPARSGVVAGPGSVIALYQPEAAALVAAAQAAGDAATAITGYL